MFGHRDDDDSSANDDHKSTDAAADNTAPATTVIEPEEIASEDTKSSDTPSEKAAPAEDAAPASEPNDDSNEEWQHPGVPIETGGAPISDVVAPAGGSTHPADTAIKVPSFDDDEDETPNETLGSTDIDSHGLVEIKQKTLAELEPLVGNLDLPAEEKFRIIMMIIQASDNQALVSKAYEAAKGIEDEKARAQALLDIVNEINYFTTQHEA